MEQNDLIERDTGDKVYPKNARKTLLQIVRAVGIDAGVCGGIRWIADMLYGVESMRAYIKKRSQSEIKTIANWCPMSASNIS